MPEIIDFRRILVLTLDWIVAAACSCLFGCSGEENTVSHEVPKGSAKPTVMAPTRIERTFSAIGVKQVILRAEFADKVKVTTESTPGAIVVSGKPKGGASGYHPADPNWRETAAADWGLDFVSAKFGDTLVISTKKKDSLY